MRRFGWLLLLLSLQVFGQERDGLFLMQKDRIEIVSYNSKLKIFQIKSEEMNGEFNLFTNAPNLIQAIATFPKDKATKDPRSLVGAIFTTDEGLRLIDPDVIDRVKKSRRPADLSHWKD